MKRRLGVLGGTFDPPHIAHLILAQHAYEELDLTKVLFVPAGQPPHKDGTRTAIEDRMRMLELALDDDERFGISRVDVDRPGPHYTIDMVCILQEEYSDAELFFIMGEDSYRDLPNWERPQEMFERCKLAVAVMGRPGFRGDQLHLDMHEDVIPGLEEHAMMLSSPLVEISSTDIVERVSKGKSIRYMVPDSVLEYIAQRGLYEENE